MRVEAASLTNGVNRMEVHDGLGFFLAGSAFISFSSMAIACPPSFFCHNPAIRYKSSFIHEDRFQVPEGSVFGEYEAEVAQALGLAGGDGEIGAHGGRR